MLSFLNQEFFKRIPASAVDTGAAGNPNGIKVFLANDLRTFFINGKPTLLKKSTKKS